MDVALVQNAEHDVHSYQRRQDQPHFIGKRRLERCGRPLEAGVDAGWHADLLLSLLDRLNSFAERLTRSEIKGDGGCRKLPLMVDRERRARARESSEGTERYIRSGRRVHVDVPE